MIGCGPLSGSKPNPTYIANISSIAKFLSPEERKETITVRSSPNERASKLFEEIFKLDRDLAIELGRIPEFQDGINEREIYALESFIGYLDIIGDKEKKGLKEILDVGKREYRKFCSPLQALFWLAEKGSLGRGKNPLKEFSLERLLDQAWAFDIEYTNEELIEIIRNLKDEKRSQEILIEHKDDTENLYPVVSSYRRFSERGSVEEYFLNKDIFKNKGINRWVDFNMVVERLNSPKLVDYYQRKNFVYGYRYDDRASAYHLFKEKRGHCVDFTEFAVLCLRKAGYKAYERIVPSISIVIPYHAVCMFEDEGKWFVMDNGRIYPIGIVEADFYKDFYYFK